MADQQTSIDEHVDRVAYGQALGELRQEYERPATGTGETKIDQTLLNMAKEIQRFADDSHGAKRQSLRYTARVVRDTAKEFMK